MASISRMRWLLILGLAWLAQAGAASAWERPRLNTEFNFRFEVTYGPEQARPTAPWYTYFPADPRVMPAARLTPYPAWPQQFPPPAPSADASKAAAQAPVASAPAGPLLTQYRSFPSPYGLQTVSYIPAQAPSYWYQNR